MTLEHKSAQAQSAAAVVTGRIETPRKRQGPENIKGVALELGHQCAFNEAPQTFGSFSTPLPVKPSQTTISVVPSKISLPSTFTVKIQQALCVISG